MAAAPVWVTGALPITVVPVLLDALVGSVLTASPAEADSRDDAGAGFEQPARVAARTIPAQPSRSSGTIQLPLYRDGLQVRVLPGAPFPKNSRVSLFRKIASERFIGKSDQSDHGFLRADDRAKGAKVAGSDLEIFAFIRSIKCCTHSELSTAL